MSAFKRIQPAENVLSRDELLAGSLRRKFADSGVVVVNMVSSPGSGKTTLLVRTITDLKSEIRMAVIEGDQQTSRDAERIAATGVAAHQINTISGCHLDAVMINNSLWNFDLDELDVVFIENVGNLVCPAAFDLGEDFRVLILSVTEGEDKPIKYPNMFMSANLILLNKKDLLTAVDFQVEECRGYIRRVNSEVAVLEVSARSGAGLEAWYQWLRESVGAKKERQRHPVP